MFSTERDASKVALHALVQQASRDPRIELIDCQVASAHLESLGARPIPRGEFVARLQHCIADLQPASAWPAGGVSSRGK